MITRARSKPPEPGQLTFDVGSPAASVALLRDSVRAAAENRPGVYKMRGSHGELLYVGKSTRIRTRILSYFRLPWPEHRHARMLRETSAIEWEYVPSEFAALLREVRLIRAHLPRYNIRSARPLDRWWVITIGGGPAPRLRVQRASAAASGRAAHNSVIGPFANRRVLVEALRVLNDALGLRDCTEDVRLVMRDTTDLFEEAFHPSLVRTPACHRYETRRCLGPCVSGCTSGEYAVQLTRARAVLEGHDNSTQHSLMEEMSAASAALSYERAGWLRDRLAALQALEAQLARVREALARPSFVYAVRGVDDDERLYLVRDGRVAAEARSDDHEALSGMEIILQRPASPSATSTHADQLDELLMIEQWFRTRPGEHVFTSTSVTPALAALRHRPSPVTTAE